MKCLFLLFISALPFVRTYAQPAQIVLPQMEDAMRGYASEILNGDDEITRFRADSFFTRSLVQALKVPHSFSYRFDSLKNISILYAPDSSFRIITWQLMKDYTYYRQKGAIQYNTPDGSLKLTPLFDYSSFTDNPVDSVRDNNHWIGAVYYKIIEKTFNNKKYYTLLGYDENDARSTKKWVDVLTFDAAGAPRFGGRYFTYANDDTKPPQPAFRFCLEYKKEANATLNYDPDLDMIIFAHLTSESADPKEKYTLVPYGSFEGFRWINGKWMHVPTVREMDPRPSINPQQGATPKENPELLQIRKKTKGGR